MRHYLIFILALIVSDSAFCEEQTWDFIESVGGLSFDKPIKSAQGWVLPVKVDVSGTQKITTNPTAMNSALACKNIASSVDGIAIYLTVITTPASKGLSARCANVILGNISAGNYLVLYKSPDHIVYRIGAIKIEP